ISDAIQNQQNFFENLWSWLNKDDSIGTKVWIFKHDDLASGGTINFSKRWHNEGDWELYGHITSSVACPADALDNLFSGLSSSRSMSASGEFSSHMIIDPEAFERDKEDGSKGKARLKERALTSKVFDLDSLRKFRDTTYREYPGLGRWWDLAKRNLPSIIRVLITKPELRESAHELMSYLPKFANSPEEKIPANILKSAETLLLGVKLATKNRRLSIDCSRALSVVPMLQRKTAKSAMQLLDTLQPSRHPALRTEPLAKITKPEEVVKLETRVRKAVALKAKEINRGK
ncbi:MAG: hypothetical protein P8171_25110, partial [Candidatus Thiodiazotropha sp.]